jgi:hypothetical protein
MSSNNCLHRRRLVPRITRVCEIAVAIAILWCAPARADVITDWNEFAASLIAGTGRSVNGVNVDLAYMHIAMYDAVNTIEGGYTPFAVAVSNVPPGASAEAAAATAAYIALTTLYPSLVAQITERYNTSLALIPNGQAKADGIAVGQAAGNGLFIARAWPADGWNANVPYTFLPVGPGVYQPTPGPPPTFKYVGPATPWLKEFRPFAMLAPSQFRADGPPALDSAQWAEDFNEVKAFGALNGSLRTPEQTEIGLFWAGFAAAPNLRKLAVERQLTLPADARFFAQTYVTAADAAVGCWDSKYWFNFWRPVTAIREADIDGNDATDADPTWAPQVVTPGHPEYPSSHGCATSGIAQAIAEFFGTKHLSITLIVAGHPDRSFDDTDDIVKEVIDARVYNGVHYRTSVVHGTVIGHKVAHWVATHYFQPIEPPSPGPAK